MHEREAVRRQAGAEARAAEWAVGGTTGKVRSELWLRRRARGDVRFQDAICLGFRDGSWRWRFGEQRAEDSTTEGR